MSQGAQDSVLTLALTGVFPYGHTPHILAKPRKMPFYSRLNKTAGIGVGHCRRPTVHTLKHAWHIQQQRRDGGEHVLTAAFNFF